MKVTNGFLRLHRRDIAGTSGEILIQVTHIESVAPILGQEHAWMTLKSGHVLETVEPYSRIVAELTGERGPR